MPTKGEYRPTSGQTQIALESPQPNQLGALQDGSILAGRELTSLRGRAARIGKQRYEVVDSLFNQMSGTDGIPQRTISSLRG